MTVELSINLGAVITGAVVVASYLRRINEQLTAIRKALEELNERQRMAVVLNKFEELNYAEIAEIMGLTTKAVKSLLSRARGRLRAALQPYVYMEGAGPPPDEEDDE